MTKKEVINQIVSTTGSTREDVGAVVEEFMKVVKEAVGRDDEVMLRGFGCFRQVTRHEKNFHYAPGKYKIIPEHREVMFKVFEEFKSAVR